MHQMTRIASRVSTHGSWYYPPGPGCGFLVTTRINLAKSPQSRVPSCRGMFPQGHVSKQSDMLVTNYIRMMWQVAVRNDMRLFLRAKQCPVLLRTTTKYWKVLLCTTKYYSSTYPLYALHAWDLRNSKNQGISGYMAPIVAQELVRTRGVSYLNLPCLVITKPSFVTGILGARVDRRYVINWKISHCLQHSWSWPYESNIRPNSSPERSKNSDTYIYIYIYSLKHKYDSPYLYNARNGHLFITSNGSSYNSLWNYCYYWVGDHSHRMKKADVSPLILCLQVLEKATFLQNYLYTNP